LLVGPVANRPAAEVSMGAALKMVKRKPTGAELGALVDQLRRAEREQAEAEERAAPVVRAWLSAQAEDERTNEAWWAAHAKVMEAHTNFSRRRGALALERIGKERKAAGEALNAATPRALAALQEVEALRVRVAELREALG